MTPPRVLLVDEDLDTRVILRALFEHAGYRVLEAATGAEGLQLAREEGPDAVVGDFPVPMGGADTFTTVLRSDPRFARVPVVSVTARALESELETARAVADEVLLKPVQPQIVVSTVSRLLGRGSV